MSANPAPAIALLERAPEHDTEADWRDSADAARCGECSGAIRETAELRAQLAKCHALLRTLRRLEPKPARAEGLDDDPEALAAIAHAVYLASVRARIDHYLQGAR